MILPHVLQCLPLQHFVRATLPKVAGVAPAVRTQKRALQGLWTFAAWCAPAHGGICEKMNPCSHQEILSFTRCCCVPLSMQPLTNLPYAEVKLPQPTPTE